MAVEWGTADAGSILRGCYIYAPYNAAFVEWIKITIPSFERSWEQDSKRWYVSDMWAERAIKELNSYWPTIDWDGYYRQRAARDHAQERAGSGYQRTSGNQRTTYNAGGWHYQDFFGSFRREQTSAGPSASTAMPSTHHAKLYVTTDAPAEVIRAAYKALALKYHPDRGGDGAKMLEVNAAFAALQKAGKA